MLYPTQTRLRQILRDELRQRTEEGCVVGDFAERIDAARDPAQLMALYAQLLELTPAADFPYEEPDELAAIQAARPAERPLDPAPPTEIDEAVADRIYGGWLGRCAGLVLGKPFEAPPFMDDPHAIKTYLQTARAYPLADYVPGDAAACRAVGRESLPWSGCQRGNVQHVEPDDDIHYTIMGLDILEQRGAEFTTADVARWWTHNLVAAAVFTAEEAAYRNLLLLGWQWEPHKATADELAQVRTWLNPYREWIGAQIRADGWALACPGDPRRSAEYAYRDAALSHVKNGVYGEMLCAAMIAAAAVCDSPREIVAAGLAQIPQRSRLAEAVRQTVAYCDELGDDADRFEDLIAWLWQHFGRYHVVHTINNAAAVVGALLLGGRDYERAISIAVMCGWDTDCNGATVGAVCGTLLGARALPAKWIDPLSDTLRVNVPGYNPAAISACAARQVAVARRLQQSNA